MRKSYKAQATETGLRAIHIGVAEKALGRKLPLGAVVHHVDENTLNNANENLVICPSKAYHNLLHQRMRALGACGNANWRKCPYCKQYGDPANMVEQKRYGRATAGTLIHAGCKRSYMQQYLRTYKKGA